MNSIMRGGKHTHRIHLIRLFITVGEDGYVICGNEQHPPYKEK